MTQDPALIEAATGRVWSHAALNDEVGRMADRLRRPRKGLVMVAARQDAASAIALLAALKAGHAVFPVNADLPAERQAALFDGYAPDWLVADGEIAARDEGGDVHADLALLLATSGSTGDPRAARLSRAAIDANRRQIIEALAIRAEHRALLTLPLHYSYGWSVLNTHLAAGACVILAEGSPMDPAFWSAARTHNATTFAGVPVHFEMIARLGLARLKVPDLTIMTQAGGRLTPDLADRLQASLAEAGGRLHIMYGQTEAAPRMAAFDLGARPDKRGSVGRALDGGRFEIEGGGEGEIVYRGPNVMMGYAQRRADLALGDLCGGRLATGDIGRLDADGFLTLTGRLNRFAKVFGLRIGLDGLEALAAETPAAAVERGGRVVLSAEATAAQCEALRERLLARTGLPPAALVVEPVGLLPRLASGKVDYRSLAAP